MAEEVLGTQEEQDIKNCNDCMAEIQSVFDKYNCQPLIELTISSKGSTHFQLKAENKPKVAQEVKP